MQKLREIRCVAVAGAFLLSAASFIGCGGTADVKPATYPSAKMAGTVSVDGTPVEKGSVMFSPIGGTGAPVTAQIVDGKFSCEAVPKGKMKVVISAMKATGKMITDYSEPFPELVNIVPPKYQSGIDFELTDDQQEVTFNLDSK